MPGMPSILFARLSRLLMSVGGRTFLLVHIMMRVANVDYAASGTKQARCEKDNTAQIHYGNGAKFLVGTLRKEQRFGAKPNNASKPSAKA